MHASFPMLNRRALWYSHSVWHSGLDLRQGSALCVFIYGVRSDVGKDSHIALTEI